MSGQDAKSKARQLATLTSQLPERSHVCVPAHKLGLGSCPVLVDHHGPVLEMSRSPSSLSVSELSPSGDVAAFFALPNAVSAAAAAAAAAAAGPPVAAAAGAPLAAAAAAAAPPTPSC